MNSVIHVQPMYDDELDGVMASKVGGSGFFSVEVWRKTPEGLVYDKNLDFHNGITTLGLNTMLGCMFSGGTQTPSWYLFPIANAGYSALASADTLASHPGWQESVAYNEAARPQWTPGAATGGSVTNTSQVVMTINADGTSLVGLGACGSSAKNSTTGPLWATGLFGSVQGFNNGDVLKINYVVNLTATN